MASRSEELISLPTGGGAIGGIGETFSPDLQTGTGNFAVPIELPPGRNGFQPKLSLTYSTGNPNGPFGLGWALGIPGVRRKTAKGIPRYDDQDVFILSGSEDLTPVTSLGDGATKYRPRTEGLYARIIHHQAAATNTAAASDYWEVWSADGLRSIYGTEGPRLTPDAATINDPDRPERIFAWLLSATVDLCGNRIEYAYERDNVQQDGPHRWDQLYLSEIRYADTGDKAAPTYLCRVRFVYEDTPRAGAFSDRKAGFEIRTVRRCTAIETWTGAKPTCTRRVALTYSSGQDSGDNDVSLLRHIQLVGVDGATTQALPPLELSYTSYAPQEHQYQPLSAPGDMLPDRSLRHEDLQLVDLFADGLPSVLQINGVARYWRNRGEGQLDPPKALPFTPPNSGLADPGVQLADMDGDGKIDLLITTANGTGYWPLADNGGFDPAGYRAYKTAPSVNLKDPSVRLIDLDGDGIIDALRTGDQLTLFYNTPLRGGRRSRCCREAWHRTCPSRTRA